MSDDLERDDERLAEGAEEPEDTEPDEAERRLRAERNALLEQHRDLAGRVEVATQLAARAGLTTIEREFNEARSDAGEAERLELEALRAGDAEAVMTARRIREKASARAQALANDRARVATAIQQRRAPSAPPPLDAEVSQHAREFKSDKPWLSFNQRGAPANAETSVVTSIDAALAREGRLDPADPAYWQELNERSRRALPRLFGEERGTRGPKLGGSRTQAYKLSAERLSALKELGVNTEDPKQLAEWQREYSRYDREHGRRA